MIERAKDTIIDTKIKEVISMAWDFGQACSDDGITNMNTQGDSHIEYLRAKLEDAKDVLYQMILESTK
jgi:hypothetical protein